MAAPKNPVGSKSDKIWRDAVMRAVKRRKDGDIHALDRLADTLVAEGLKGEISALKEIGDRLDGKSVQGIVADVTVTSPLAEKLDDLRQRRGK